MLAFAPSLARLKCVSRWRLERQHNVFRSGLRDGRRRPARGASFCGDANTGGHQTAGGPYSSRVVCLRPLRFLGGSNDAHLRISGLPRPHGLFRCDPLLAAIVCGRIARRGRCAAGHVNASSKSSPCVRYGRRRTSSPLASIDRNFSFVSRSPSGKAPSRPEAQKALCRSGSTVPSPRESTTFSS